MPERKKQHYVPQLYMRGFTENEELPSYQLEHHREFPSTPIRNLCYEDYFYGDEGDAEVALSKLEDRFASVLRSIRSEETLDALESPEEEMYFLIFLSYTHERTKTAKRESRELTTEMVRVLLEANEGAMEGKNEEMRRRALEQIRDGDLKVEHTSAFPMQELMALYGPLLIGDLVGTLLKDISGRQFIFSDHPVALDNPMTTEYLGQANIGFQTPGIQIHCPISSDLAVMMYDPACYNVTDEGLVEVGSDTVEELNKLQLSNALDAVFYEEPGRGREMAILHDEIDAQRTENLSRVERFDGEPPRFDTDNEVVEFGRTAPGYSPNLPFVELTGVDGSPARSPERVRWVKEQIDDLREMAEKQQAESEGA